ncbi:MAG: hypothetical protein ACPH2K_07115 [Flavicella sp.]
MSKVSLAKDMIVHKGVFSQDTKVYYYTVSKSDYTDFDVYQIEYVSGNWSRPRKAFFNSDFDDHGMSFSPDGNTVYFSSTRPTGLSGMPLTWHLWKSVKKEGVWLVPEFVDIPNLKRKLLSHPVVVNSGKLYFHVANLDYSNMDLYHSSFVKGKYQPAVKCEIPMDKVQSKCTVYVSPDEEYLLFATVGFNLDLYISYNNGFGSWNQPIRLNPSINTNGRGNPVVTPDGKFLLFTQQRSSDSPWKVVSCSIEKAFENLK